VHQVLLVIHLLVAIALVGIVLIQRSEGGGLGLGGGGGAGGGMMSIRGQANFLTRVTGILAAGFMLTSIGLAVLSNQSRPTSTIVEEVPVDSAPLVPELPATPTVPTGQ
jgi:preprotein translocase subunit SecG